MWNLGARPSSIRWLGGCCIRLRIACLDFRGNTRDGMDCPWQINTKEKPSTARNSAMRARKKARITLPPDFHPEIYYVGQIVAISRKLECFNGFILTVPVVFGY
jgi:hypothetical protein